MNGPFDDLADQLEALAAELDDRAFELLRAAMAEGGGRPADDKRLTQARRAVEKAVHLLRGDGASPTWSGDE